MFKKIAAKVFIYLAFPAQPPKQLIGFEFGLLIGHNTGHFENKPGLRLFVKSNRFEGQHSRQGRRGIVHVLFHKNKSQKTENAQRK